MHIFLSCRACCFEFIYQLRCSFWEWLMGSESKPLLQAVQLIFLWWPSALRGRLESCLQVSALTPLTSLVSLCISVLYIEQSSLLRFFFIIFLFLLCEFTINDLWERFALGSINGIRLLLLSNCFRFWSEPIMNKHRYQPAVAWQWNNNSSREALFIGINNKKKLKKRKFKEEE